MDDLNGGDLKNDSMPLELAIVFVTSATGGYIFSLLFGSFFLLYIFWNVILTIISSIKDRLKNASDRIEDLSAHSFEEEPIFPKRKRVSSSSEEKKPGRIQQRSTRIVLFLVVLCCLLSTTAESFVFYPIIKINYFLCQTQAFLLQMFGMCVAFGNLFLSSWLCFECVLLKCRVVFNTKRSILKWVLEIFGYFVSLSIGFILAIVPLFMDRFGPSGSWCFLVNFDDQLLFSYIPLWTCCVLIVIFYSFSFILLATDSLCSPKFDNIDSVALRKHLKSNSLTFFGKMVVYPVLFVILWIVPSIHRILMFIGNIPFWILYIIDLLHFVTLTSFAGVISFSYFFSPIAKFVGKCFRKICPKKKKNREDENEAKKLQQERKSKSKMEEKRNSKFNRTNLYSVNQIPSETEKTNLISSPTSNTTNDSVSSSVDSSIPSVSSSIDSSFTPKIRLQQTKDSKFKKVDQNFE